MDNDFKQIMEVLNQDSHVKELGEIMGKAMEGMKDQSEEAYDKARELYVLLAIASNEKAMDMLAESVWNKLN